MREPWAPIDQGWEGSELSLYTNGTWSGVEDLYLGCFPHRSTAKHSAHVVIPTHRRCRSSHQLQLKLTRYPLSRVAALATLPSMSPVALIYHKRLMIDKGC